MFYYEVSNLYIGSLGYVTQGTYGNLKIECKNEIIIYKKEKVDCWGNFCAKEIFTNQKFYFFKGNKFDSDTIDKAINGFAIYSSSPLSMLIQKKRVTKKQLKEIYSEINKEINQNDQEKEEESTSSITDNILQMILETSKKVKNAEIDECLKAKTLADLEELSEYYVTEIINKITSSEKSCPKITVENEYTIKMNTIRRLVEIEGNYQNPEQAKKYSLKRQLQQVKKEIK